MSSHKVCFNGEIRKISVLFGLKIALSGAKQDLCLTLTVTTLLAKSADDKYFSYFSQQIGFDISCKFSQPLVFHALQSIFSSLYHQYVFL